jgi:two-component system sensor histidine kinase QseC
MKLREYSIQARLTLLILSAVLLFGLIGGYVSYSNALKEADNIFDAQLAQFAQNLIVLATHTDPDADNQQTEPMLPSVHQYQQSLAFQVWNTDTHDPILLLRSNNIANMTYAQRPRLGFSTGIWKSENWRYYRQRDERLGFDVLVGQNNEVRGQMASKIAWHNLVPFLLGLPLLALLATLAIRLGLRPLPTLTKSLLHLSPDHLHPLEMNNAPREISPVIEALNSLLKRIVKVMENERRFTADASHELRTPLAALQAQVQAAQLSTNSTDRKEGLSKALQCTERMTHLVEQLLTLSRLDEVNSPIKFDTVNLFELTQECCAELGINALAKGIEIGLTAEVQPLITGSADMLRILLRNLLDNAIRYSPPGGQVEVTLRLDQTKQGVLEITDSGLGVADEKLSLLGQRFNRISPKAADGVGLGLSIVQRIAEIHQAKITFSRAESLGGLCVSICFPVK